MQLNDDHNARIHEQMHIHILVIFMRENSIASDRYISEALSNGKFIERRTFLEHFSQYVL